MKFNRKFDFEYRIPNRKRKKHLHIIPSLIDYNNEIAERLQIIVKTRPKMSFKCLKRQSIYIEYTPDIRITISTSIMNQKILLVKLHVINVKLVGYSMQNVDCQKNTLDRLSSYMMKQEILFVKSVARICKLLLFIDEITQPSYI